MSYSEYRAVVFRAAQAETLARDLFRFRKRLFVDLYEWDIPHDGDLERDEFDHAGALYTLVYFGSDLVGTFRAIRTDEPYLTRAVFDRLAVHKPLPCDRYHWEISRFGVWPSGAARRHALVNYAVMFRLARHVGARALVATGDRTYERFLEIMGIVTRRFGPPQALCCDRRGRPLEVIAGEIAMADQAGAKFERFMRAAETLEIDDVADVFGPARLSA